MKVLLRNHKENEGIEFAPVYFKYTTKTAINSKYMLDKPFQEILCKVDNWINERSGWIIIQLFNYIIESLDAEYVNASVFIPLSGSTHIEFQ